MTVSKHYATDIDHVMSHIQNRHTAAILVYSTKFVVKAIVQVHVHVPLYKAREAVQCTRICRVSCKRRQMDHKGSAKPPLARQK